MQAHFHYLDDISILKYSMLVKEVNNWRQLLKNTCMSGLSQKSFNNSLVCDPISQNPCEIWSCSCYDDQLPQKLKATYSFFHLLVLTKEPINNPEEIFLHMSLVVKSNLTNVVSIIFNLFFLKY